mmetsp:Transcript_12575/g.25289  ORF Transcript_12575/g.25289 Transcript_12575/m.25289 type:complete len:239 (-) Transcript_12575:483-1199(-)
MLLLPNRFCLLPICCCHRDEVEVCTPIAVRVQLRAIEEGVRAVAEAFHVRGVRHTIVVDLGPGAKRYAQQRAECCVVRLRPIRITGLCVLTKELVSSNHVVKDFRSGEVARVDEHLESERTRVVDLVKREKREYELERDDDEDHRAHQLFVEGFADGRLLVLLRRVFGVAQLGARVEDSKHADHSQQPHHTRQSGAGREAGEGAQVDETLKATLGVKDDRAEGGDHRGIRDELHQPEE